VMAVFLTTSFLGGFVTTARCDGGVPHHLVPRRLRHNR